MSKAKDRENDGIRESSNGNLVIHMKDATVTDIRDAWYLLNVILDSMDCYCIGEQFSLGNFDMGQMIYNAHDDLVYTLPMSDLYKLMGGEEITLYARTPDEDDRELIDAAM